MNSEINKLLEIMESLLAGELCCEEAQQRVDALSMEEFPDLYGNLFHYYGDDDIRKNDSEYKQFQDGELVKLISHLKSGDIKSANSISFLHES